MEPTRSRATKKIDESKGFPAVRHEKDPRGASVLSTDVDISVDEGRFLRFILSDHKPRWQTSLSG